MASDSVLVDTSCWIEYFNRPGTGIASMVEEAVRRDQAALTGVVLAELSQGARRDAELSRLRMALGAVRWVTTSREVYERAGGIGFELRRRGVTVPVTDCVIAAAAESIGGRILTLNGHFVEISKICELTMVQE